MLSLYRKRLAALLLATALTLVSLPSAVLASQTAGDLRIDGEGLAAGTDYVYDAANRLLTLKSNKTMTISGSTSSDIVVIDAPGGADITLDGLNIDVSGSAGRAAMRITGSTASAGIKLKGVNSLRSGKNCAGLQKENSQYLCFQTRKIMLLFPHLAERGARV